MNALTTSTSSFGRPVPDWLKQSANCLEGVWWDRVIRTTVPGPGARDTGFCNQGLYSCGDSSPPVLLPGDRCLLA